MCHITTTGTVAPNVVTVEELMCVTMSLVIVLMGVNNIGLIQNVMVRIFKRDFDYVLRTIKGVQNLQFEILDRLKGKDCLGFFLIKKLNYVLKFIVIRTCCRVRRWVL